MSGSTLFDGPARRSLWIGLIGLGLCAVGGLANPAQLFRSYLTGWLFWLGIALGSLGLLMLQHLSGGAWGIVIRRPLEAATRTLPLLALMSLPIAAGLRELYPWARPEIVAADTLLQHKSFYLNVPFFFTRAVVYFLVWGALAASLNRWSVQQDESGDPAIARRLTLLSGPGILLYVLTMTFASVDWMMSLEPHWFSTIYGFLIVAGQVLAALAFAIVILSLLSTRQPLSEALTAGHFNDLGSLLLALVMIWSYFAFSQFLIIWSGNLPEEIPWYLARLRGGWEWIGLALVVLQFAVPFLLLLSRNFKSDPHRLAKAAGLILVMRLVDLHWMTSPAFHPEMASLHWLDIAAPAGIGGIWLRVFLGRLGERSLLPAGDAGLAEAIAHGKD